MDTFSRKDQILKFDSINPYDFFDLAPVFFHRVLCFVGRRVFFLTFLISESKKYKKKQYVLYENCDIGKAQNPPNATLVERFYF